MEQGKGWKEHCKKGGLVVVLYSTRPLEEEEAFRRRRRKRGALGNTSMHHMAFSGKKRREETSRGVLFFLACCQSLRYSLILLTFLKHLSRCLFCFQSPLCSDMILLLFCTHQFTQKNIKLMKLSKKEGTHSSGVYVWAQQHDHMFSSSSH